MTLKRPRTRKESAAISAAAAVLGRIGGLVSTPKKRAAVRENGKLGGRPRRRRV